MPQAFEDDIELEPKVAELQSLLNGEPNIDLNIKIQAGLEWINENRYTNYNNNYLNVKLTYFYVDRKNETYNIQRIICDIGDYLDDLAKNKPIMTHTTKQNRIAFLEQLDEAIGSARTIGNDHATKIAYDSIARKFKEIKGEDGSLKSFFTKKSTLFAQVKSSINAIISRKPENNDREPENNNRKQNNDSLTEEIQKLTEEIKQLKANIEENSRGITSLNNKTSFNESKFQI
jgi:hypothetical protein